MKRLIKKLTIFLGYILCASVCAGSGLLGFAPSQKVLPRDCITASTRDYPDIYALSVSLARAAGTATPIICVVNNQCVFDCLSFDARWKCSKIVDGCVCIFLNREWLAILSPNELACLLAYNIISFLPRPEDPLERRLAIPFVLIMSAAALYSGHLADRAGLALGWSEIAQIGAAWTGVFGLYGAALFWLRQRAERSLDQQVDVLTGIHEWPTVLKKIKNFKSCSGATR